MNRQYGRTIQDTVTTLAPADVLAEAKRFFAARQGIYAAFPEKEGPTYVDMRGQVVRRAGSGLPATRAARASPGRATCSTCRWRAS